MVLIIAAIIALFVLRGKTDVGPMGPQGPRGLQGEPGTPGSDGARGFQGFNGSQGPQGNGTGGGGSVVMEQRSITIVSDPTFSYNNALDTAIPSLYTRSGNVITLSLIIPQNLDVTPGAFVIGPNIPFVRIRFNLPQPVAVTQAGSLLSVNILDFSGTLTSNLKYTFMSEVQSGYLGTNQSSINDSQLIAVFRTLDGSAVWNGCFSFSSFSSFSIWFLSLSFCSFLFVLGHCNHLFFNLGTGSTPPCKTYFTVSYRCAP